MSYPLSTATHIANRLVEILSPVCDRIHIAGSIRRCQSQVKDIEIVCQPKMIFQKDHTNLFQQGEWVINPDFQKATNRFTDKIEKGKHTGRYMKIILKGGMPIDLFMPAKEDYFRQLIIRTGSTDYVHHVIAASWRQKGWCGVTGQGLRLMSECTSRISPDNKTVWYCNNKYPTLPPAWQSEEEVFAWLGLLYTPPECREVKTVLNHHQ